MAEERCGTCKHWQRQHNDKDAGWCRRYPPVLSDYALRFYAENPPEDNTDEYQEQLVVKAGHGLDVWFQPVTLDDDFCGEWRAKDVTIREG